MNFRIIFFLFLSLMACTSVSAAQPSESKKDRPPEIIQNFVNGVRIGEFDLRGIKTWGEFLDRYPQVEVSLETIVWYAFGGDWHPDAVVRDRNTHETLFALSCGCSQPEGSKGKTLYFNGHDKRGGKIEVSTFREAAFTDYWVATTNSRYQTSGGIKVGDTLGELSKVYGKIWILFDLNLEGPFVSNQVEYLRVAPKRYEMACVSDTPANKKSRDSEFGFVLNPPPGALIAGMYGKDLLPGEYRNTSFITGKYHNNATIRMITTINRCREMLDHEG